MEDDEPFVVDESALAAAADELFATAGWIASAMEMEMEMEGATADDGRATVAEAALRPADDEQQRPVGTWTTTHAAAEEEEEEDDEEREWRSVAEAVDSRLDRDEGCCWADKSLSLASCLMAHFDRGGIAGGLGGRHQQRESFPLTDSEDSALRDGY